MDVSIVLKVGGLGILVGLIVMILKNTDKGEYAPLVTIAGIVIALAFVIQEISSLLSLVQSVFRLY